MSDIIRIENLVKHFLDGGGKRLEILNGISHAISVNQTVSIVGRSGSGKSTLLQLLGGLDHPTQGKVFFKDENIFEFEAEKLSNWRNRHIGFVFQSHHLMPDFTAIENIMIPAMVAGNTKQKSVSRARELLEQVELDDRADHKPGQLSGGEQQRVAIARALVNSPEVILADEPTGNLDIKTGDKIGILLQNICREQKTTLIVVTHNIQLATSMDSQYELSDGKLVSV
jgi:lipoprotein-releasing system ATP-binding protein